MHDTDDKCKTCKGAGMYEGEPFGTELSLHDCHCTENIRLLLIFPTNPYVDSKLARMIFSLKNKRPRDVQTLVHVYDWNDESTRFGLFITTTRGGIRNMMRDRVYLYTLGSLIETVIRERTPRLISDFVVDVAPPDFLSMGYEAHLLDTDKILSVECDDHGNEEVSLNRDRSRVRLKVVESVYKKHFKK